MPEREAAPAVPRWIEDATRRVQAKLAGCDLPPVLGHADWEAQNIRWRNREAHVVHDWDSLAWLPEAAIAGSAAGIFASHGKTALAPLASSEAFLHAYENERGARFSPYETEIAWAGSIWEALHNACDELSYNRPKLSYEQLKAQRVGTPCPCRRLTATRTISLVDTFLGLHSRTLAQSSGCGVDRAHPAAGETAQAAP
jgi:hypothetical protein